MATTYFESPTRPLSYEELTSWGLDLYEQQNNSRFEQYLQYVNSAYPDADLSSTILDETSKYLDFFQANDGSYIALGYKDALTKNVVTNPLDSNQTQVSRGTVKAAVNHGTVVDSVTGKIKRNLTRFPIEGSFASQASYIVGSVSSAIGAVSTGISLGKVVSNAIYENFPNYWPDMDWSSFNPETWNGITNGDDSPYANALNFILGLDPETSNSQAYMSEDAYAYMAYLLSQNNWFTQGYNYISNIEALTDMGLQFNGTHLIWEQPIYGQYEIKTADGTLTLNGWMIRNVFFIRDDNKTLVDFRYTWNVENKRFYYSAKQGSPTNNALYYYIISGYWQGYWGTSVGGIRVDGYTFNGLSAVCGNYLATLGNVLNTFNFVFVSSGTDATNQNSIGWAMQYGDSEESVAVPGVSNQPTATLPDTSTWVDVPTTLQSLQSQYPDLWNDKLVWEQLQPDGTVIPTTYIPVPLPDATFNADTQPTGTTATQSNTIVSPDSDVLTKLLTQIAAATQMQTATDSDMIPTNPTDTGTGSSPIPSLPTGSASALWSVYHPSAAQINAFGAWLWTDNVITQFIQAMNNPMEGIISLHKIFAPPVDSGQGTIVIGRLDSEVPTATVTEQYVEVDCGSVSLQEQFGNIFDYIGTEISIYLPFIGVVPLNINDIMRSTLNVKYEVDVFTGACLATINVQRDGYNPILYQFAGTCSVEYPLTGSQHSGLISGLFGIASGIGALMSVGAEVYPNPLMFAGAAIGTAAGVVSGVTSHTARSGALSSNVGAMGIKKPYIIIERPQTKVADLDTHYTGLPTNYTTKVGDCTGMIKARQVHVKGINATEGELRQIEAMLHDGILVTEY